MLSSSNLLPNEIPAVKDPLFVEFKNSLAQSLQLCNYTQFIDEFQTYLESSRLNRLQGLDQLHVKHVMIGCNHFIDSLIVKHGLENLQIFEHDYKYYRRLNPELKFAVPGDLDPNRPLLIAAPFPGCLDLHWYWNDILDECDHKQIPVHVDAAWLGLARDIHINLERQCIRSIGISLSKGLGLSWNRVGVRWSKDCDETDSITIMNRFNMIPDTLVAVGLAALRTVPVDYLWDQYHDRYYQICRELRLRPTKIVNAAMSLDRKILYGLSKLL
jgi:hypothetical protein